MNTQYDHADKEVKGIERYLPTKLSKALAISIIPSFFGAFGFVINYSDKLIPNFPPNEQKLIAFIAAATSALIVSLALIIDLVVIIFQSKHRRITHHSNVHPYMTFKWLKDNATLKHWLFLILIFLIGVECGVLLY